MLENPLPKNLLLLLFGIKQLDGKTAEDVHSRYENTIASIFMNTIKKYLEKNPEDTKLKKIFEVLVNDPTALGDNKVLSESELKAYSTLMEDISNSIREYNLLLIDGQVALLSEIELARIVDYLKEEKELTSRGVEEIRAKLEAMFPERLRKVNKLALVNNKKEVVEPKSENQQENFDVNTNKEQVDPSRKQGPLSLEQLVGEKDGSALESENNQGVSVPEDMVSRQANTMQEQPVDQNRTINIVDQAAPKQQTLEQEMAPKLNLGGQRGHQDMGAPKVDIDSAPQSPMQNPGSLPQQPTMGQSNQATSQAPQTLPEDFVGESSQGDMQPQGEPVAPAPQQN